MFVVFSTLRGKYGGGPPFQSLVPFFGTLFVVVFLAVQVGLCFWFRSKIAIVWIAGGLAVGLIGGTIYERNWRQRTALTVNPAIAEVLKEHSITTFNYDWTQHKLVAGVCLSAVAFGTGLVTNRL